MAANNSFNHAIDTASAHARALRRSATNRWIGGVAGGLAETYGWNPALVRVAFVATLLFPVPGSQILMYALAWLLIPKR
ncbi:PspC domain-containing protein [uncultured Corynebacterium sp.]|uniref:PspC domain-containing protein n=1 Tax=uncultured Corynebacterium sp. TaxID=159447 RepID=UPI0025E72206|nr:PspC domain-containing protein [uncultured Corynebacterium sp.]